MSDKPVSEVMRERGGERWFEWRAGFSRPFITLDLRVWMEFVIEVKQVETDFRNEKRSHLDTANWAKEQQDRVSMLETNVLVQRHYGDEMERDVKYCRQEFDKIEIFKRGRELKLTVPPLPYILDNNAPFPASSLVDQLLDYARQLEIDNNALLGLLGSAGIDLLGVYRKLMVPLQVHSAKQTRKNE